MRYRFYSNSKKLCSRILVIMIILINVFCHQLPVNAAMTLTAKPAKPNGDTEVSLQWSHVNGAKYYTITRILDGNEEQIAFIDVNTSPNYTSYTDKGPEGDGTNPGGLLPGTTYLYRLDAYKSIQDLNDNNALESCTGSVTTEEMKKPSIVSAKYNVNDRKINLRWNNNSKAVNASEIRITYAGNTDIYQVDGTATSYSIDVNNIPYDTPVKCEVVSKNSLNNIASRPSEAASVIIAPSVSVNASVTDGKATISWGSYAYISSFQLERSKFSTSSGSWGQWQVIKPQLQAGTSSTTDTLPEAGTYRYRLNAKAESSFEGYMDTGTVNKPGAPTNLSCKITGTNSIDISWDNNINNPSRLLLQRKKYGDSGYSTVAELSGSATSYRDTFELVHNTTYYYRLVAYENENNMEISSECSIKTVPPAAPSMLSLTVESSSIRLNWKNNAPSDQEFSFRIERKIDNGAYVQLATVDSDKTTYLDEDNIYSGHTYSYRVCAFNPIGDSAYTNEVSTTTEAITAPNFLEVTAKSSTELELNWGYPENISVRTVIERKKGVDGVWAIITSTSLSSNVTRYVDSGLSPNTQYFYRVRAVSPSNSNVYSKPYPDNDTGIGAYTKLGTITLYGFASAFNEINLFWTGIDNVTEYVIERKSASGNFSSVATITSGTRSWQDKNLVPNAQYTYRVLAKSATNESAYSNELTIANSYLDAPSNLTTSTVGDGVIELKWIDNAIDETGFEIWRSVGTSDYADWSLYATVGQNAQSYKDTNVQPGIQYNYRVRAYSVGDVYSAYSNTSSIGIGILNAPSNLKYEVISDTKITLTWKDNSNDETGFVVERKIGADGTWTEISTLKANTTSYTLSGLNAYTQYFFRIKAYSYKYNSDSYSNEIEVSTGIPKSPSNLELKAESSSRIKLVWTDNSTNEQGFIVERMGGGSQNYKVIAYVDADVTTYTDTGLNPGTRYYYRVKAYNKSGTSSASLANTYTKSAVTFKDINSVPWAVEAIEDLASRGVINGKGDNNFKPNDTITRAEFVCIIVRALGLQTTPADSFVDVKPGKWYYNELMSAKAMGITTGDSSNRFYPDEPITREDIAVILVRAGKAVGKPFNGHSNSVLEKFHDKNLISPYAIASVASLHGEGVINGKSGNMLAPKDKATRAEAAVMIHRVIDRW
ncbi:MAG TPA: hypothetical protein GXX36_15140 [Clostridiaceae bacterium]|nr:hypothetical protein [Clostridiaceae bacterium]